MADDRMPCVRRAWLYYVVREFQVLADRAPKHQRREMRAALRRLPPETPVEELIVRGLIASAPDRRGADSPSAPFDEGPSIDPKLPERLRAYIDRHYQEHLTICALAQQMCASRSRVSAAFRERYGTTIHSYLTARRRDAALAALRSSTTKVEAVALETGYRSKKDLYRVIKAATGLTPSQVRRRGQRFG